ncbi:MAG: hypothetical protein WDM78_24225 [Puia sp.]
MKNSRRDFIRKSSLTASAVLLARAGFSASSYNRIIGANDRVRVAVVGFSDRHRSTHMPCFMNQLQGIKFRHRCRFRYMEPAKRGRCGPMETKNES